jgi:gas vesicle protein
MSGNKFIKGGILGALVGAVAGILFAPKSGKETREDLKQQATKAKSETEKQLKQLFQEVNEQVVHGKTKAQTLSAKAKSELEEVIDAAQPLQAKLKELISNVREGSDIDDSEVESTMDKARSAAESIRKKLSQK